jgi:hypothetical protein
MAAAPFEGAAFFICFPPKPFVPQSRNLAVRYFSQKQNRFVHA